MRASRLALALLVSLRAVLIYGEAPTCTAAELTWRELLPAHWRGAGAGLARARTATAAAAPAPQPAVGPSA
jgi:hypothetical protein